MKDIDSFVKEFRQTIKNKHSDKEIVQDYLNAIVSTEELLLRYPSLSILLFEKNNSIMSEDKFPNSYVVDYRLQWIVSNKKNEQTIFSAIDDLDEVHYMQVHLYLYYQSERFHSPAKLINFEFNMANANEVLAKVQDFSSQLDEKTKCSKFLGCAVAHTDAM